MHVVATTAINISLSSQCNFFFLAMPTIFDNAFTKKPIGRLVYDKGHFVFKELWPFHKPNILEDPFCLFILVLW